MTAHRDTINAHNAAADERRKRGICADTAQLEIQDMDGWMQSVRNAIARGASPAVVFTYAQQYRYHLYHLSLLQEMAANHGWNDPVFLPLDPLPIRHGLVGLTDEERRAVEWKPYN